jgi:hypothetical protein
VVSHISQSRKSTLPLTLLEKSVLVIYSSVRPSSERVPHVRTSVRGLIKTGRSPIKGLSFRLRRALADALGGDGSERILDRWSATGGYVTSPELMEL